MSILRNREHLWLHCKECGTTFKQFGPLPGHMTEVLDAIDNARCPACHTDKYGLYIATDRQVAAQVVDGERTPGPWWVAA